MACDKSLLPPLPQWTKSPEHPSPSVPSTRGYLYLYDRYRTFIVTEKGFHRARQRVLTALQAGNIQFEARDVIEGKNLLDTGEVSAAEVARLIRRCRGHQQKEVPHHWDREVTCHIFCPEDHGERWYIKVYFEPNNGSAIFISVHHPNRGS